MGCVAATNSEKFRLFFARLTYTETIRNRSQQDTGLKLVAR